MSSSKRYELKIQRTRVNVIVHKAFLALATAICHVFRWLFPQRDEHLFFQEKIFTIYKVLNSMRLFKGTKQMRCVFWTSLETFTHTLYSLVLAKLCHKKSFHWLFWLSKTLQKLREKTIIFQTQQYQRSNSWKLHLVIRGFQDGNRLAFKRKSWRNV